MKKISILQALVICMLIGSINAQQLNKTTQQEVKKYKIVANFNISVDYDMSIESVISLNGFDYVNPIILKNLPIQTSRGKGNQDEQIIIIEFENNVTSSEVETAMNANNIKPANIWNLGSLAQKIQNILRIRPIVFLGSIYYNSDGYRAYPVYYYGLSNRDLLLIKSTNNDDWNKDSYYCFAAIKK